MENGTAQSETEPEKMVACHKASRDTKNVGSDVFIA